MIERPSLLGFAFCAAGASVAAIALVCQFAGWDFPLPAASLFFMLLFLGLPAWVMHLDGAALRREHALDLEAQALALAERAARLAEPEPELAHPADDRGWYLALYKFILAGHMLGFTGSSLSGVVGSDGHPALAGLLVARGVLADYPGSRGFDWAPGVALDDALRRLRAGSLAPYPDSPSPNVTPPRHVAARRSAPRKGAVIEHRARTAE